LHLVKTDATELKAKYGDPRRTDISEQAVMDFDKEDLIPHQRVVVPLSNRGFIKRVPSQVYTPQHRGGKGIKGMETRDTDAVRLLVIADTHDTVFYFTSKGKVFRLKCYELPSDTSRISKGVAIINLFPIGEDERVTSMVPVTQFEPGTFLLMATRYGEIKKTAVEHFAAIRSSGLIAMDLEPGDELISASLATDKDDIILITEKGQSIRFSVSELRASSRTSGGVRSVRLAKTDCVVSMDVAYPNGFVLVVSSDGYGKLTPVEQYPCQHRAGSGVITFKTTDKTGEITAARVVSKSQQVMIISSDGKVIRTPVKEKDPRKGITVQGRSTQGVKLMDLNEGDKAVAITAFD